jgi:perosamine synthetase
MSDSSDLPPLALARPEVGEREEELVGEVLRSGRLSLGPMQDRFEAGFASWLGVEDAIAVSSGTTALHLGVRALGWDRGSEALTSPFSFVASANCLLYEGVKPVFCDIDPVTLNINPEIVEAEICERTAGILPVHIFGYPADMPEIQRIAEDNALNILEDACEALGAVDAEGTAVGARGNLATFAFYANKQMTTGEGGMIIPYSAPMAERLRSERNQGRAADMGWLDHGGLGFNYRLSDIAAALGVAQLEKLDAMLERRSEIAAMYERALEGIEGVKAPIAGRGQERRSWFVYVIRLPERTDRYGVIETLAERGIASKAYLPCIHLFPHLRELGYTKGQFPVAEDAAAHSLALPFHTAMTESDVARVCRELAAALGQPSRTG